MIELISGKEALIALANGEDVETKKKDEITWSSIGFFAVNIFKDENWEFRLKPRTVNLNGVDVGQLKTAMWCRNYPKEVNLEFKTEDDAHHFYANAIKIFNGV
jgi:hypothetical protein